ncbi:MAG TPA: lycopene cyclase domain-containing protein [Mycobacteriales bacterium]
MRFLYVGVLAACLLVTLPLELVLGARVYGRWRRWLLSLAPVFVLFTAWDSYGIWRHHWVYSPTETTGWRIGNVPLEELAFFVVVPTCAILTYEAVGVVWPRLRRRGRT